MSYDPSLPVDHAKVIAAELRGQFAGLKTLIDAGVPGPQGAPGADGPQGPQGVPGPQGDAGPQGNTGAEGRSVSNVYDDGSGRAVIQMSDGGSYGPFTIASGPQGPKGDTGDPGAPGSNGSNGCDGAQGPQGNNGADGSPGPQGPQGNPGEVSNADLSNAVAGSSANSNGVEPLSLAIDDPPTQAQLSQILNKLNELIAALRR